MTICDRASARSRHWTRLGSSAMAVAALSLSPWFSHDAAGGDLISDRQKPTVVEAADRHPGGEGAEDHHGSASPETDDVAFLTQLELIRGHLTVGVALYREGEPEAAKKHMKHPADELYASLQPALEARKAPGFADALQRLASAVERELPDDKVDAAFESAMNAINASADVVDAGATDCLKVVHRLVETAAGEFEAALDGNKVVEPQEYQDAYGFVQVAHQMLDGLTQSERKQVEPAASNVEQHLDHLDGAWPSLMPPATVNTDPGFVRGAAAMIEASIDSMH